MSQVAKEPCAKVEPAKEADWTILSDPETVKAVHTAARIIASKYGDRAVNMLAEYDDLVQEGYILVATKPRLQGLDPKLLIYRLTQELNGRVKYGAPRAKATTYLSALSKE